MFNLCSKLESIPALNTSLATTMPSFQSCISLQTIPTLNASANTGTLVFAFQGCTSLSSAVLSGNKKQVSYINCKLSRQAIVDIFNALGTADGATTGDRTITVTSNWGAPSLTAGDLAIATAKNWTVAV
jgi:hypothetical protein